ncbi:MAG TPA: glycerophosphodiester phosphodiesterase [Gemmatimonadaceae bacterium]
MHPLLDLDARPVVGHRGNAAHAPENTMESFRQAVELGVDALELDVHLSADGHAVVIHDSTLDRTSNGSGRVERMTLAEIQSADAGARFSRDRGATRPYREKGIRVPTLDEVLATFPQMPLLIELKTEAASRVTRAVIERHGAQQRCIVASFREVAMDPFRGSGIAQGGSRRDTARLLWRALLRVPVRDAGFNVLCMPPAHRGLPLPVAGYVRILEPSGVPVHCWTIDDPGDAARLRRKGVRGIISNDPGAIIHALARR